MRYQKLLLLSFICLTTAQLACLSVFSADLPADRVIKHRFAGKLLGQYCGDCHNAVTAEGGFVLRTDLIANGGLESISALEHAHQMISKGIMPPTDAEQLPKKHQERLADWLDDQLMKHSPIGGTPLRRLSGREYANTVRAVFGFEQFQLPLSFPPDNEAQGFDNQGASLVMAGSHLEAFCETANSIADQLIPPPIEATPSRVYEIPAKELVVSYSSAMLVQNAMRLASSGDNPVRNATWPSKFEAPVNGIYTVDVKLRSYVPESANIAIPELLAQSSTVTGKDIPQSDSASIVPGDLRNVRFQLGIDRGGTVEFRYPNGPFKYDNKAEWAELISKLFESEPKLAHAWKMVGSPPRGGSGWDRVKDAMKSIDSSESLTEPKLQKLIASVSKDNVRSGETLVYKYFEEGPYLAIESVSITGPISEYQNKDQVRLQRQRTAFYEKYGYTGHANSLNDFFHSFLSGLFRRPATDQECESYTQVVLNELKTAGSLDQGLHLAIRTALISPAFLYRCIGNGKMSDFDLASRLSYFFTSGPPDKTLMRLASQGRLSEPSVLRQEAGRLMDSPIFAKDFTSQWLQLESLDRLMPDQRLLRKFTSDHRDGMKEEVIESFRHVLSSNLPLKDLIAPDFVFTNQSVGQDIYEFKSVKGKRKRKGKRGRSKLERITVDPGERRGGLLSMPAIMMATANGVDTQPVLRGVWVLNNILGSPPPEPPKAVPALTPDTQGTSTPKARLAAHMAEESCAVCHRDIDPIGFALESYDAIGRWREYYPTERKAAGKTKVDTSGRLPNGIELSGVIDLKRWLSEDPTPFARCLSEKLMMYATGRKLNYRERSAVGSIVKGHGDTDFRIRDLIESLVLSDVFRTK